jgi:zinc D-Ala-D-Ala carboxypeptidase
LSIIAWKYFPVYDFDTDSSLHKFVSPFSSLQNELYVPQELVSITKVWWGNIVVKNNDGKLRSDAASALADLAVAFHQQFSKPIIVVSSYRSYGYQKNLLAWYTEKVWAWRAGVFSAKPGHSEHQLGLAIDLFNASTDGIDGYKNDLAWMRDNAHLYGWTQSYQKWVGVDGYIVEPWHWRYVGNELATYLWENKMTFTEYVRFWWVWRTSGN